MNLNLRNKLNLKTFAKETREIDGEQYTDCTGMGLSGSMAMAFGVIRRDNKSWAPSKRYKELKALEKSIVKDLKEYDKLNLKKKAAYDEEALRKFYRECIEPDPSLYVQPPTVKNEDDFISAWRQENAKRLEMARNPTIVEDVPKAVPVGPEITKLDLGDTFHGEGRPLESGWTSIALNDTDKFLGDYTQMPYHDNSFEYAYGSCFLEFETADTDQDKLNQYKELYRVLKPGGEAELSSCGVFDDPKEFQHLGRLAQQAGFEVDLSQWKTITLPSGSLISQETPQVKIRKPMTSQANSKLNLKKKALDIGGVEFPDVLKYPQQGREPSRIPETTPGTMQKQDVVNAENNVYFYIQDHLKDYGVDFNTPDDRNVIQTAPDKIELNPESPIIQKLFYDGWFEYLDIVAPFYIQENTNIQETLLNYLIRYFKIIQ